MAGTKTSGTPVPVKVYTKRSKNGRTFDNMSKAAEHYGLSISTIRRAARDERGIKSANITKVVFQ